MSKRKQRVELHDFYCLKCGNKGIGVFRNVGFQRERFHRKRLYCPFCKEEVNHIECKTYEEVQIFKDAFERGEFKDEAEESVSYLWSERMWQKLVDSRKN